MKRFELPQSLSPAQLRAADSILKEFIADLIDQVCEYLKACEVDGVPAIDEGRRARLHALTRPGKYKDTIDMIISDLESMVRDEELTEPARARIHALTRTVTISDKELAAALRKITDRPDVLAFVLDLRDRYEERGRYAINAPQEAPAPSSESPQAPNTPIR